MFIMNVVMNVFVVFVDFVFVIIAAGWVVVVSLGL